MWTGYFFHVIQYKCVTRVTHLGVMKPWFFYKLTSFKSCVWLYWKSLCDIFYIKQLNVWNPQPWGRAVNGRIGIVYTNLFKLTNIVFVYSVHANEWNLLLTRCTAEDHRLGKVMNRDFSSYTLDHVYDPFLRTLHSGNENIRNSRGKCSGSYPSFWGSHQTKMAKV